METTKTTTTNEAAPQVAVKQSTIFRFLLGRNRKRAKRQTHEQEKHNNELELNSQHPSIQSSPNPTPPIPTTPSSSSSTTSPMDVISPNSSISLTLSPQRRFILSIDAHSAFFWTCSYSGLFDRYTFAAVFELLWRFACSGISLDEAFSATSLFFALHLCWETEEDSISGRKTIAEYVIGRDPRKGFHPTIDPQNETLLRWKKLRTNFMEGWTYMWERLGFQTYVDWETVQTISNALPFHPVFTQIRSESQRHSINRE